METLKAKINNLLQDKQYDKVIKSLKEIIKEGPTINNYIYAEKIYKEIAPELHYKKTKIAILRSVTIEPILQYLTVKCFENGINPEIYLGEYNIFEQEILNSESELYKFTPDFLFVFARIEELAPDLLGKFLEFKDTEVEREIFNIEQRIEDLISIFRQNSKAKVIIHNFEMPEFPVFGIVDTQQENSQKLKFIELNSRLLKIMSAYDEIFVLDYDHLISKIGRQNWFDEKFWYTSQMPISRKGIATLADEYLKFIKSAIGMTKKCLVLDLDNTLWGGVLGEEGVDGIKIGSNYPGIAFTDFQKEILKLYNKGFILSINSKNNESDIMEVFEHNKKMILKKEHFAAIRINWQDKAQNMRELAEELNIGLDSLVFFDDNPVERELIKQELPMVQVVEMPTNPIYYKRILNELDCFEMLSYSKEDLERGKMYSQQCKRKQHRESFSNLDKFYKSLEMIAIITKDDKKSVPRLAKMTQKTNQFNLTTIRYSESDIVEFIDNENTMIYSLQLKDKFGDNGIVGEIIIKENSNSWEIDSFLLSCRVMGRTVETAFLSFIIEEGKKHKIKSIFGKYIPSPKNAPIKNIYSEHGFDIVDEKDGIVSYVFDLKNNIECPEWVNIKLI